VPLPRVWSLREVQQLLPQELLRLAAAAAEALRAGELALANVQQWRIEALAAGTSARIRQVLKAAVGHTRLARNALRVARRISRVAAAGAHVASHSFTALQGRGGRSLAAQRVTRRACRKVAREYQQVVDLLRRAQVQLVTVHLRSSYLVELLGIAAAQAPPQRRSIVQAAQRTAEPARADLSGELQEAQRILTRVSATFVEAVGRWSFAAATRRHPYVVLEHAFE
jgi:hypothetical protein